MEKSASTTIGAKDDNGHVESKLPAPARGGTPPPEPSMPEPPDKVEDPDKMSKEAAHSALELMLDWGQENPPDLPEATVNMAALATRLGVEEFKVTVRALTEPEMEQAGRRSERKPTAEEKEMGMRKPRDLAQLKAISVSMAMMDPELTNSDLLARYGPTPVHVVKRWFLTGEIDRLYDVISDLTGYGDTSVERLGKS